MDVSAEWVSAIGGIFAFLAAAFALALQTRELRLQREELVAQRREMAESVKAQQDIVQTDRLIGFLQFQTILVEMAMKDEDLRAIHGAATETMDRLRGKQWAYINLWIRLFQTRYAYSDGATAAAVRGALRHELFATDVGLEYWGAVGARFKAEADSELEHQFFDLVNDEWMSARRSSTNDC